MSDTPTKPRFPRADALAVAEELLAALKPYCERIEIAGSLRRGKESVGDVELIYIPKFVTRAKDMFENEPVDLAAEKINWLLTDGIIAKRLNKLGVPSWGAFNKLARHKSGIPVDLFQTDLERWNMALVLRTGSKETNLRLIAGAAKRGFKFHAYGGMEELKTGKTFHPKSEAQLFEWCGLNYLEPRDR